ncbi:MAG: Holliday junction resolvase [Candidatus Thermoplasmatota archaeon]|jgi:Holliday junction resolvase|nr:Holliday junction resolvase [Candidatus Thermoplasmatota archaeon]MDP7266145.1 Holliday junction resolvase [Candidatus Thermoplasmatota archaeon]
MSTKYERELVGILRGDPKVVRKASRSMDLITKGKFNKILNDPFLVLRAAGSLGVDLAALRGDISFPIEVKSSIKKKVYLNSDQLKKQAEKMIDVCRRTGVIPLYAYRYKNVRGDSWRMFTLPIEGLVARNRILYGTIPTVTVSSGGNYVLEWEKGMPLSALIDYLDYRGKGKQA